MKLGGTLQDLITQFEQHDTMLKNFNRIRVGEFYIDNPSEEFVNAIRKELWGRKRLIADEIRPQIERLIRRCAVSN